MKTLVRVALLPFLFMGCLGITDDEPTVNTAKINPGFYEVRENLTVDGTFIAMAIQVRYMPSQYQVSLFLNDIEVTQSKGDWKVVENTVQYTGKTRRDMNDAGAWGPWMVVPDGESKIRNVTKTSYQEYVDYSEILATQQGSIQGAVSGWKTYNRIGD